MVMGDVNGDGVADFQILVMHSERSARTTSCCKMWRPYYRTGAAHRIVRPNLPAIALMRPISRSSSSNLARL